MALIRLDDGTTVTDAFEIASRLKPLGIELHHWPIPNDQDIHAILTRADMSDEEKKRVLTTLEPYFEKLRQDYGYKAQDLIGMHGGMTNLDEVLTIFNRCHTHPGDEFRYVVDGEAVWGLIQSDDSKMELLVQAGEAINVPAGAEHWFDLTPQKRFKAVRYFQSEEGWKAEYTGRKFQSQLALGN